MKSVELHLKNLGLTCSATWSDIKSAYRAKAKCVHPDRFANDTELRGQAVRDMQAINNSYERLDEERSESGVFRFLKRTFQEEHGELENGVRQGQDCGYFSQNEFFAAGEEERVAMASRGERVWSSEDLPGDFSNTVAVLFLMITAVILGTALSIMLYTTDWTFDALNSGLFTKPSSTSHVSHERTPTHVASKRSGQQRASLRSSSKARESQELADVDTNFDRLVKKKSRLFKPQ